MVLLKFAFCSIFFFDFLSSYVTMETGEFEMGIITVIANVWVFIGGGLNKNRPHRLIENSTIRCCGTVGGRVS